MQHKKQRKKKTRNEEKDEERRIRVKTNHTSTPETAAKTKPANQPTQPSSIHQNLLFNHATAAAIIHPSQIQSMPKHNNLTN